MYIRTLSITLFLIFTSCYSEKGISDFTYLGEERNELIVNRTPQGTRVVTDREGCTRGAGEFSLKIVEIGESKFMGVVYDSYWQEAIPMAKVTMVMKDESEILEETNFFGEFEIIDLHEIQSILVQDSLRSTLEVRFDRPM